MAKSSGPRVCIDRVLPKDLAKFQATRRSGGGRRGLSPIGKTWINGSTLRVRFMGGTAAQRALVKEQAGWWTEHANLKFDFNDVPDAEIRITFDSSDGAWSYVGTDAKGIPQNQPTMNLGFMDGGTVAHEFGHAIGLAHEHQNPAGGIQWNEPVVIAALKKPPNSWTEEQIRHNVLRKYSVDQVNGTSFDKDSIMLYFFPKEWTLNGVGTEENEVLSATDKQFIAGTKMYPRTGPIATNVTVLTVGAARTNGDIGKAGEEDLYSFKAGTDGRYVIETRGTTDVFMKLFGPNSPTALIKEDDDSGIGANSLISADLIKGEYFVQIRHFSATRTGRYSIGVRKV